MDTYLGRVSAGGTRAREHCIAFIVCTFFAVSNIFVSGLLFNLVGLIVRFLDLTNRF